MREKGASRLVVENDASDPRGGFPSTGRFPHVERVENFKRPIVDINSVEFVQSVPVASVASVFKCCIMLYSIEGVEFLENATRRWWNYGPNSYVCKLI